MSKKDQVLTKLFEICQKRNNYVFDNDLVKDVSKKVGFGNPFDATKIDNKVKLPQVLRDNDFAVIHLGKGRHQFIKDKIRFCFNFTITKQIKSA
jgi:type I site-specific restriction-modification system R (restriction) subunit